MVSQGLCKANYPYHVREYLNYNLKAGNIKNTKKFKTENKSITKSIAKIENPGNEEINFSFGENEWETTDEWGFELD